MPVDLVAAWRKLMTDRRDRRGLRGRSFTNNASELGDGCLRKLVYKRVAPEDFAAITPELQSIFEWGDVVEEYVSRRLSEAGFRLTHAQMSTRWEKYNLSGHIDGYVQDPDTGEMIVIDIKGLNPYDWDRLNTVIDVQEGWTAKYLAQLVLYLWLENKDHGLLFIFGKSGAWPKQIDIYRENHIDLAESLLQRAEQIELHVAEYRRLTELGQKEAAEASLPEGINVRSECERCGIRTRCNPILEYGPEVRVIEDARLAGMFVRREALDSARREYEALDRELKDKFNLSMGVDAGDWLVSAPDGSDAFNVTARRDKRNAVRKDFRRPAMLGAATGEGDES